MPNSEYKHTSTREKFFSCEVAFLRFFFFFTMFHFVQRVDQSESVRVEQHSDENKARQRGCGLSAAGRAVLCGQQLSGGIKDGLGGQGEGRAWWVVQL